MAANPPTPIGVIAASEPPAIITSASPRRMISKASPIACADAVRAGLGALAELPDVPTLKELGYPMVYDSPFGIAGPKGMDPKIVAKLHDAFKKALDDPAVIATLAKFDMVPNYKNTEDYKKFVVEVTESERKVIDTLGLAKKTN